MRCYSQKSQNSLVGQDDEEVWDPVTGELMEDGGIDRWMQNLHTDISENTNEKVVTIKLYQSYYSTFKILSCILIVSLFGTLYFYKKK